jgi:hypothetical protein
LLVLSVLAAQFLVLPHPFAAKRLVLLGHFITQPAKPNTTGMSGASHSSVLLIMILALREWAWIAVHHTACSVATGRGRKRGDGSVVHVILYSVALQGTLLFWLLEPPSRNITTRKPLAVVA